VASLLGPLPNLTGVGTRNEHVPDPRLYLYRPQNTRSQLFLFVFFERKQELMKESRIECDIARMFDSGPVPHPQKLPQQVFNILANLSLGCLKISLHFALQSLHGDLHMAPKKCFTSHVSPPNSRRFCSFNGGIWFVVLPVPQQKVSGYYKHVRTTWSSFYPLWRQRYSIFNHPHKFFHFCEASYCRCLLISPTFLVHNPQIA